MKRKLFFLLTMIGLFSVLLGSGVASAQGPQPPPTPEPPFPPGGKGEAGGPQQGPDGTWYMPEGAQVIAPDHAVVPLASGGPDDFGYTWDDTVAFSWVDATAGSDTGLAGDDSFVGPLDIGFSFKFYENTYTQLYISTNGFVSFGQGYSQYANQSIPSPAPPNNYIAPFWDDLTVGSPYNPGKVYFYQGGTAPNRYSVVEWYSVTPCCSSGATDYKTFEVILHENGDVVVQYLSLLGYLNGATVGIEDDVGITGLQYLYNAPGLSDNKAVRFYRPPVSARVKIWPAYQGRFSTTGEPESFQVSIRNTGELGADTYDITTASTWQVSLYAADGTTALTDTDFDGTEDIGSVAQGSAVTIIAKVGTPGGATLGDANSAIITARSSLDPSKSKTATLQTAVPASFAQIYRDNADGAMSLYLVQPNAQAVKKTTPDWYYGSDMAVAEMPDSFAYFWTKYRWTGSVSVREIEYTLLDRYGNTVRAVSPLTYHSGATMYTYDYSPAVAVAPNGRIGVLWYRYRWDSSISKLNYNIWFAILDASGNVVYGPANITNNNIWGTWGDLNVPRFYSPRIAATGDSRFVIAWQRYHRVSNCTSNDCSINDIYYAVLDTGGGEVKGITQFTNDTTGSSWEGYYVPNLTSLTGNRALITWYRNSNGDIYYAVLDSSGNVIKDKTNLSGNGSSSWDWSPDAVQLSDGKIVVGWTGNSNIWFAVLDTNYNRTAFPSSLDNPATTTGNDYVSVAADNAGRAILTWMDSDWSNRRNLYYALVNGNGGILTQPMIFRTSQASTPYIETSYVGYGNTSYSSSFATGVDTAIWPDSSLVGGAPGGAAPIGVNYTNYGQTTATGVVMTATLGTGLTYLGDTSGISPLIAGNLITWDLPVINFLDKRQFVLYVSVPDTATIGTRYAVTLALTTNEIDANASDNTANLEVMAALQVYLPLIMR